MTPHQETGGWPAGADAVTRLPGREYSGGRSFAAVDVRPNVRTSQSALFDPVSGAVVRTVTTGSWWPSVGSPATDSGKGRSEPDAPFLVARRAPHAEGAFAGGRHLVHRGRRSSGRKFLDLRFVRCRASVLALWLGGTDHLDGRLSRRTWPPVCHVADTAGTESGVSPVSWRCDGRRRGWRQHLGDGAHHQQVGGPACPDRDRSLSGRHAGSDPGSD